MQTGTIIASDDEPELVGKTVTIRGHYDDFSVRLVVDGETRSRQLPLSALTLDPETTD